MAVIMKKNNPFFLILILILPPLVTIFIVPGNLMFYIIPLLVWYACVSLFIVVLNRSIIKKFKAIGKIIQLITEGKLEESATVLDKSSNEDEKQLAALNGILLTLARKYKKAFNEIIQRMSTLNDSILEIKEANCQISSEGQIISEGVQTEAIELTQLTSFVDTFVKMVDELLNTTTHLVNETKKQKR